MNARVLDRTLIYGIAVLLAVWVLIPFYIIAISAFTPQAKIFDYPKPLIPTTFSTETMQFFVDARGVIPSVLNSVLVAVFTIVLGLALGTPAGYALARFHFRGREAFQVIVLATKMFPIAILSIPLAVTFLQLGLYDNLVSVALVHTAMALPFIILVTGGVFVAVSHELEEAPQRLQSSLSWSPGTRYSRRRSSRCAPAPYRRRCSPGSERRRSASSSPAVCSWRCPRSSSSS